MELCQKAQLGGLLNVYVGRAADSRVVLREVKQADGIHYDQLAAINRNKAGPLELLKYAGHRWPGRVG